jgi:DmsE family decaheme c-type cytochrome
MKTPRAVVRTLWLAGAALAAALVASAALAQHAAAPAPLPAPGQYSAKGADTCLECHAADDGAYSGASLFKSRHAARGDQRAPFGPGGLQCEACHGPGALHARNKRASAIVGFKAKGRTPVAERNRICLACHEGGSRTAWHAGAHERSEVACTDCHEVHASHGDPMLAKARQPEACLGCHKSERADFHKASSHPVRQGLMACSDCHAAHGSSTPGLLARPTLNQTCLACHADKRGPLLWEHAPVAEDCALCHTSHGSVRSALLVKSAPLLCQSCHSSAGHPAVPRTPANLPGGSAGGAIFAVAGSCTNCHSQVHGSNHPSGAKLLR